MFILFGFLLTALIVLAQHFGKRFCEDWIDSNFTDINKELKTYGLFLERKLHVRNYDLWYSQYWILVDENLKPDLMYQTEKGWNSIFVMWLLHEFANNKISKEDTYKHFYYKAKPKKKFKINRNTTEPKG